MEIGKRLSDKVLFSKGNSQQEQSNANNDDYNYYRFHNLQDDPAIFTEFNTAAYRFGHSQVKSFIEWVY